MNKNILRRAQNDINTITSYYKFVESNMRSRTNKKKETNIGSDY